MIYTFQIIFYIFFSIILSYEPTTIKASIIDKENNPINDVYIHSQTGYAETDKNGMFIILYKNNNELLTIEKIGYETQNIDIKTLKKTYKIILNREIVQLNEEEILGISKNVKKQNSTNDIQIYSNSDFKSGDIHFDDIIKKIPNLNYAGGTSRNRYFQIRGIGERSQYAGEGGPIYYVGTVIDDIDVSGIGMAIFLDNVKQIEVYQGPQSYAYGHNAMAGLINIKTMDPRSERTTKKKFTIGNDELLQASYFYDAPLIENTLLMNHLIYYSKQNGFIYNTFLNDYKNNKSEFYQKIKFLYNNKNFNSKLTLLETNLNNGYDAWAPNNNPDTSYTNQPGNDSQRLYALSLKNAINLNKNNFIHIFSILKSDMEHSYDGDWGNDIFWASEPYNYDPYYYGYYAPNEYSQMELRKRNMFSNEFRYILNLSDNIIIASGIYYKKLKEIDEAYGWILGGEDAQLDSEFNISNYAFYNESKIRFKKIELTLNMRIEKMNLDYFSTHFPLDPDAYDITNITINDQSNLNGNKISLLYQLNKNNNIFLTLSNGFKAGSVNQNPRLSVNNQLYKPEYNQNIDIGYRFKNDKSSLNIIAFYMNRKDLQVSLSSQQEATNPNSFYFYTSNASNGYNTGLNLDFNIISDNNFESYLNLGLLKTKIDAYDYMIDETTIITFDSREAAHAPSYTLSWGFTKYHKNINYGLSVESKNKFYFSDSHNEESEPYSIANIHFDYQVNSNAEISLWSKNIFNKKYATRGFYFINEPPWDTNKLYLSYGEPFTIGITLKYNY